MEEIRLTPFAPALIESMRSVGYSLETSIADLLDNSISAGAKNIRIRFDPLDIPYIAIIDDGHGMDPEELTNAMRHGSTSPLVARESTDLGRFGLGLKTASLSQCRNLTVISKKNGTISARQWNLDLIMEREDWILLSPNRDEIRNFPHAADLDSLDHGTVVVWQDLDRLIAGEKSVKDAIEHHMHHAREHLGLVFHRYLSDEPGFERVAISINENPVMPVDPFLRKSLATQALPVDKFVVEGETVTVTPYILPHISKLTPEERKLAGGEEGLRSHQGFYVYRNRRLVIWGTWFRLARMEELSKLARVQVDIPNSLDHLWTLDVKKSTMYPPHIVRQNISRIIGRIAEGSKRVYTFRGRKTPSEHLISIWSRIECREGIFYRISKDHPMISAIADKLDSEGRSLFYSLFRTIENGFPKYVLYADMASDSGRTMGEELYTDEDLLAMARNFISLASETRSMDEIMKILPMCEPFGLYPEQTVHIMEVIKNG